jgi:hypothetical protein
VPLQAGHFSSFGFDLMGFMGCFSTFMANEIRGPDAKVSGRRPKQNGSELIDGAKHPDQQMPLSKLMAHSRSVDREAAPSDQARPAYLLCRRLLLDGIATRAWLHTPS